MASRRSLTTFVSVLALFAAVTACGDDGSTESDPTTTLGGADGSTTVPAESTTTAPDRDPAADGSYSVAQLLAEVPADFDEPGVMISTGDIEAATAAAGIERPSSIDGDVSGWLAALTGVRTDGPTSVFVPLASSFQINQAASIDEFEAEVGWSVLDAHTFVEAIKAPRSFMVISGDLADDVFESADVIELPEGIVSAGEGKDHLTDLANRTAARPLGAPLRMAVREGRVAASTNISTVAVWHHGDLDSLAGRDAWSAVARSLDSAGTYSAVLHRTMEADGTAAGYDVLGIGWALDGDEPVVTIAFHHADPSSTAGHAADLRAMFQTGTSVRTRQPISDLLALSDVVVDGNVVVVTATLGPNGTVATPYSMLQAADGPFAGS